MDSLQVPQKAIYWFSSVPLTLVLGDLHLAYFSDLLFGCKDSENFSVFGIIIQNNRLFYGYFTFNGIKKPEITYVLAFLQSLAAHL